MNLSKRLQTIADFVVPDSRVCDIGTDHGYIPVYLIKSGIAKKVIATDISRGSLDKIIDLIEEQGLEEHIEARLGDGLNVLKENEVDTLVIAGMGGILISEILEAGKSITENIDSFILQPMVGAKELRKYLLDNNYKIISEELVFEEGKYYEIISAIRDQDKSKKEIYYEISEILIKNKHPLLKEFIKHKRDKVETILIDLKDLDTKRSKEKYNDFKLLLGQYEEVLMEIES